MGVFDKLVTGPYWRKCEAVGNVLDLNQVIEEIQRNCLSWLEDSSSLLFDQKPGFERADVHKDEVYKAYNALFAPQSEQLDQFTQIALEIIMGNFCLTIARQMESVLEGNLHNPSDELREETKNAPTTNAASERVFSSFDRLIRERPHATTLNLESTILFETNQTAAWLSGLDDSTKKHYMEIARKSAKTVLKDYQKRKIDIEERIRQNMLAKQKKAQEKERDALKRTRTIIAELQECGCEWSLTNIEEKYNKLKDANSQRNALICQLKYYKFVLKSKCDDKKRFQQTVQGRAYSLSELKENLFHIIQYNEDDSPQPILEQQQMSVVEMQEKLKLAKETIKLKLEKLRNRKKSKPSVKNRKT